MATLLAVLRFAWVCLLVAFGWAIGLPRLLLKGWLYLFSLLLTIVLAIFLIEVLWVSPRDVAYRYVSPAAANHPNACDRQQNNPLLLATYKNSENEAQRALGRDKTGLECMLQYHVVPSEPVSVWYNSDRPIGPIGFYLSFLEFQESGRLVEKAIDRSVLEHSQLEVLEDNLGKQKKNYVLVFIHGWRHDARIGDANVANARIYAAYAASALDYRCKTTGKDCDYTVTAVFIGWRGARVNERAIEAFADRNLGFLGSGVTKLFSGVVGGFPALLTLFDRKPISERIAPSVIASLRHVDRLLKKRNADASAADRLIVIGHSLVGILMALRGPDPTRTEDVQGRTRRGYRRDEVAGALRLGNARCVSVVQGQLSAAVRDARPPGRMVPEQQAFGSDGVSRQEHLRAVEDVCSPLPIRDRAHVEIHGGGGQGPSVAKARFARDPFILAIGH